MKGYLGQHLEMQKKAGVRTAVEGWLGRNLPTFTGGESRLRGAANRSLEEFHAAHARSKAEIGNLDSLIGQKHALLREMDAGSPQATKLQKEIAALHKKRSSHISKAEKAYQTAHYHNQNFAAKVGDAEVMKGVNARRALIDDLKGTNGLKGAASRALAFAGRHKWKLALGGAGLAYAAHKFRKTPAAPADTAAETYSPAGATL